MLQYIYVRRQRPRTFALRVPSTAAVPPYPNDRLSVQYHDAYGFALIEVLIAMVVLSLGLLGAAKISLSVIRSNAFSKQLTIAITLAQDQIEVIQGLGYSRANGRTGTEPYKTILNYPAYKRVTTIQTSTPAAGMHTATVSVFWNGDKKSVTLSTILGQ